MTSRPIPTDLLPWAQASLPGGPLAQDELCIVAGDASNRRYFRLQRGNRSYIVAEAPPATEKNEAFVAVRDILARAEVKVPEIISVDYERGYLLLEDLGDRTLLPELTSDTVDAWYAQAFVTLEKMAAIDISALNMGAYDQVLLGEELSRFPAWFVEKLLGYHLSKEERELLGRMDECLLSCALEQPQVLVHRDFHSRNLMVQSAGELAVIDFQDAVVGPVSYDLVSLLRDCYIRWPAEKVQQWALCYYQSLRHQGKLLDVEKSQFLRWFDWMGLQRHIKVLGTFARLSLRDGKAGYLEDLPLVIAYVEEILAKYEDEPVFGEFRVWFTSTLSPLIASHSWSAKP